MKQLISGQLREAARAKRGRVIAQLLSFPLKLRNRHFFAADLLLFMAMPALTLVLRTDGVDALTQYAPSLAVMTFAFLMIKLGVFLKGGLYSRYWRYASVDELTQIVVLGLVALGLQTAVFFLVLRPNGWVAPDFPRLVPVIEGVLSLMAVGGLRYSVRWAERLEPKPSNGKGRQRVIVVGAGWAGVSIVREMQSNPQLGMNPVAFVDDAPDKQGMHIGNVPVLGKCEDITRVAGETGARQVVIAMPTAPGRTIREIVSACEDAGLHAKTVPGMYELLGGSVSIKQLRDIRIEDLLRREPVNTDTGAIAQLVRGKRVLVTGAGGSIGSELCRQVLSFGPSTLVLLGHGENSIFEIYNELEGLSGRLAHQSGQRSGNGARPVHTEIYPVIADIRDERRIGAVFDEYLPEVVFHAAAHKHVHLMEGSPEEAVTNNVLGTRNLLDCALEAEVEYFVMISTDKAVNPVGVIGASKRVAELLVHKAAERSGKAYVAVRFGNVLGSRGSVVLTFQRQIAVGGPITITHPEMKRYFMTVPEAVQLVLQAVTLGRGGEVFMLDMGEPVKIVDLARDLIELSGLQEGHDIDIEFTGLRPGEKLYEEMFIMGEEYRRTRHEKVLIAYNASSFVPVHLEEAVAQLQEAAKRNDGQAVLAGLCSLVPGFEPSGEEVERSKGNEVEQPRATYPVYSSSPAR